ncbi:dipeptidase PepV [Enterococcus florum]|uniref:Dipeptidase PepV n=1 Tax=Enterococcus florum TaxID=2480627 RepID=A0A4P5P742_9ENTE|nr:dipeptidase PepV [Enterococcus florum]GCF93767.1 dipeptidase PepV [Enterococcus florum]
MTIDWKKEVDARKDDLLADLNSLLKINSERDDSKATKEAPFGPGPKEALEKMLALAERDGFATKNVDNYAGHIDFGEGDETLGIFGHLDVVPAGEGWDTNPYDPVIKDGKLYARGSSDDKGPTVAAYYGMKIIKELGLPVSKKIRFVIGTDEESGWGDMDYYFEHEEKPDFGFSPDAEFPMINGEKGNVTMVPRFAGTNGVDYVLKSFEAGLRVNMVPGNAKAVVTVADEAAAKVMADDFADYVENNPISGSASVDGRQATFELVGKAAHGASPQSGINAGTFLAVFLESYEFDGGARAFIKYAANEIHEDVYGKKLSVAFHDEKMGDLTMNAGVFQFNDGEDDNTITLNFRYPKGISAEEIQDKLSQLFGDDAKVVQDGRNMAPHYVPMDDPMVVSLMDAFEEHTGLKGDELIIGGGTFGRLLERGVAFGAQFPGYTDTMHQANEYMPVEDILRAAVIYADAIYRLAK